MMFVDDVLYTESILAGGLEKDLERMKYEYEISWKNTEPWVWIEGMYVQY